MGEILGVGVRGAVILISDSLSATVITVSYVKLGKLDCVIMALDCISELIYSSAIQNRYTISLMVSYSSAHVEK